MLMELVVESKHGICGAGTTEALPETEVGWVEATSCFCQLYGKPVFWKEGGNGQKQGLTRNDF